ncbi:MAG: iron-sulfur cluster assembly scaffold protein [Alphaproteobacteria bacterium]|nr:iron-sulfur cluster assembly scaffold protein [Alphaproteobacteria bacterium]
MSQDRLYQDQLLALARLAREHPMLDHPTHRAEMLNPSCGDKVTVSLTIDGRLVKAMAVKVRGCAICEASAGLIHHFADTHPAGMNSAAFKQMIADIPEWFADPDNHHLPHTACAPLMPVKLSYRNRIRCATLPFEAYTLAYDSPI